MNDSDASNGGLWLCRVAEGLLCGVNEVLRAAALVLFVNDGLAPGPFFPCLLPLFFFF